MDSGTIFTETPQFIITKEYDSPVKIEDLVEVFIVIFRIDLPKHELTNNEDEDLKKSCRYLFFTDLERALKQYKYYGPRGAVLSRVFTDKEDIIETAQKSNFTIIPEDGEEAPIEEKELIV
jgi:hypothetical protein